MKIPPTTSQSSYWYWRKYNFLTPQIQSCTYLLWCHSCKDSDALVPMAFNDTRVSSTARFVLPAVSKKLVASFSQFMSYTGALGAINHEGIIFSNVIILSPGIWHIIWFIHTQANRAGESLIRAGIILVNRLSQWENALHSNASSHWLSPYTEWSNYSGNGLSQWEKVLHSNASSHWVSPYPKWFL